MGINTTALSWQITGKPLASFAKLDWDWMADHWVFHCFAAFSLTLLLQRHRGRVDKNQYSGQWRLLFYIASIWGGLALFAYLPKFFVWHSSMLFLPELALFVGLAKLRDRMTTTRYIVVVLLTIMLFGIFLYSTYGIDLEFNLSQWLQGLAPPGDGGRDMSGGGAGFAAMGHGLGEILFPLLWSPGLILLTCLLAVPPRRTPAEMDEREQ